MLRQLSLALLLSSLLVSAARAQTYEPGQNYVVRQGQLPYAGRTQYSVNVVVDGPEDQTRDFFQTYMKSTYRVSFKGGLAGLLAVPSPSTTTIPRRPATCQSTRC